MKVLYTVHTVAETAFPVKAKLEDGTEIDATVPGFTYELMSDEGDMVHTFHTKGTTAEFAVDDKVVAEITKA